MTLNDLEQRNIHYFAFLKPNSIVLLANYVTVIVRKILSPRSSFPLLAKANPARSLCDS